MEHTQTGRRIGIISYDFDPPIGGLGVLVRTYQRAMKKLFPGDTFTVFSPADHADERPSVLGRFRYRKRLGCPLFSLSLLFSLKKFIRRCSIDLLHVHAGSGGVFLLWRPSCRVVVTAHHTYHQEAKLVFADSPLKRMMKLAMGLLESRTYHLADRVICVSKDTADEIIRWYQVPASKVCVIENPIEIPQIESLAHVPKKPDTFLYVGRLEPRKGILVLLKAFHLLLKDFPHVRLRLIGSNLMGDQLALTIQALGITDAVQILGYIDNPNRFREMAEATVVIVPSVLEGFGLVAAEAMVLGTCVIASDAPGLRSVVADGRTGLVFPVGNAVACAAAMKRMLIDTHVRASLVQSALLEASSRFSLVNRTHDVSAAYDQVLKSPC